MPEELLALAAEAARRAGALLVERFAGERRAWEKTSPRDLVGDADLEADAAVVSLLRERRPDDAIVAEESGEHAGTSGLRWAVDALDGTTNFVAGVPHWAVAIGCEDAEGPLLAVVHDPLADELVAGARGRPPTLNGAAWTRPRAPRLEHAVATVGINPDWHERRGRVEPLDRLLPRIAHGRLMGSLALDLAWTALGRFDFLYHEAGLSPWDVAPIVLCSAAGLEVRMLPEEDTGPRAILAAQPELVDELLAILGRAG